MPAGAIQLLTLIPMFVVFYFLLIRPQQKKAKKLQAMRDNLEVGNKVITIGGMVGVVKSIDGDELSVKIKDTVLVFKKWAISSVEEIN